MVRTILVPLDGSPLAERALPHAEVIARATGARLALVRATHERVLLGADSTKARVTVMREAESYLTARAGQLGARDLTVDTGVISGDAAESILLEAQTREADLIVMATHGRTGLGRLVFGSVAETVLRRTTVPLLLVRAWGAMSEVPPLAGHPRLIVPLDGSLFAEEALPVATNLAMALGGDLVLLHAVSPFEQVFMPEAVLANFPEQEAARGEEARQYLRNLVVRSATGGCAVHFDVRLDMPALAIKEAVDEHAAALVVMATHGRTAMGRLVLGSVADAVLKHSRVPLLLVRPRHLKENEQPVGAAPATKHPELRGRMRG